MKKLVFVLFFLSFYCLSAQYVDRSFFKAGFHGAIPVGETADIASFSLGVDLFQHWGVSKEIDLGIATGFTNAFLKDEIEVNGITIETDFDNVQFLPVAGLIRIYPTSSFNLGADVGYAVGINEGNDGGFYYRPCLSLKINSNTELHFSYTGVSQDGSTWSTVTGGIAFLF